MMGKEEVIIVGDFIRGRVTRSKRKKWRYILKSWKDLLYEN